MSETIEPTSTQSAASAIAAAGYAAYSLTIVGHAAPIANAYRERVTSPLPGDLVLETSTFYGRSQQGRLHEIVGVLRERVTEHVLTPPTDLEPDGWAYDEEAWYVEPLDGGDATRWTNAEFIAIPRSAEDVRKWQGRA